MTLVLVLVLATPLWSFLSAARLPDVQTRAPSLILHHHTRQLSEAAGTVLSSCSPRAVSLRDFATSERACQLISITAETTDARPATW